MHNDLKDVQAIVAAGQESVTIEKRVATIKVNGIDVPVAANGVGVAVIEAALAHSDARQLGPRRRTLNVVLADVASFIAYVNRHKDADSSVIYANPAHNTITCVFDDFPSGPAQTGGRALWREHRALYACPLAPEWVRWTALEGKAMGQVAFGDLIDAQMHDLTSGEGFASPPELLQMARSLQVNSVGRYKRVVNPTTGEGSLICETEHGPESTRIPRAFLLALRVFEGGALYQVEARLRFSMMNGAPTFSFDLHRREELERDAFGDVRKAVSEETGVLQLAGVA